MSGVHSCTAVKMFWAGINLLTNKEIEGNPWILDTINESGFEGMLAIFRLIKNIFFILKSLIHISGKQSKDIFQAL